MATVLRAEPRPSWQVVHGPARAVVGASGTYRPFHGIAPRALLGTLPSDDANAWTRWSPTLDAALGGNALKSDSMPVSVIRAARRGGVLTFEQSAMAAQRFIEDRLDDLLAQATRV